MIPVVIGAAYGDEGKGATVNKLATPDSVVVRFNGGCQAGHTVVEQGIRRVFSHVGAGTLKGATTYLSKFFVSHPLAFLAEWYDLRSSGIRPTVWVSPQSPVTTFFDVAINRALETKRGIQRHGSVGVGFNETLERNLDPVHWMTVGWLAHSTNGEMLRWLKAVQQDWAVKRCQDLDIDPQTVESLTWPDATLARMVNDFNHFLFHVRIMDDEVVMQARKDLVFEGAQGLMLDQTHGTFPHVTRSNTGLENVLRLLPDAELKVYYVTRSYTTRHGPGPFPHELASRPYAGIVDDTNIHGPWQGPLRFSYLNLDTIQASIARDMANLSEARGDQAFLHMTCLDQVPEAVKIISQGRVQQMDKKALLQYAATYCGCQLSDLPV